MRFDPDRHHRVSVRLPYHAYSQGTYFVTICSLDRQNVFSTVVDGIVELTEYGGIIDTEWRRLQSSRFFVHLDRYVVMPDHFHGLIEIQLRHKSTIIRPDGLLAVPRRQFASPVSVSLQSLIGQFKSRVTKQAQMLRRRSNIRIWQPGFYEHVVRDQDDLERIRRYITDNPKRWRQP